MIGALIKIGEHKQCLLAIIIDKFPVGFSPAGQNMEKEYYYETYSMGDSNGKRRNSIHVQGLDEAGKLGKIQVIAYPRKS